MYQIINMTDHLGGVEVGINYYHSKWGNEKNYRYLHDAITHSTNAQTGLPRFYLLMKGAEIVGCYGLVTNDFISRHDLYPWLAGLYVNENERGQALGNMMLSHGEVEAKKAGYSSLYLVTDHDGYYEKYGWKRIEDGYEISGASARIYMKSLKVV
ncbi:MAG: GCN5-related N-acetyltransferase [uncultured bacterium]|nr:MAG: GCN5-related N-acetyltransferase [uncultured bacterium]